MTYKGDPIAEKLDKIAEATGVPRLSRQFERGPVRFRVFPLILLAIAIGGLWVQIAITEMLGYYIIMAAWMASYGVQVLSPLRYGQKRLDEREAELVRSGHFAGLVAAMGVAVLGCLAIGMGSMAELVRLGNFWAPDSGPDWFALALFLLAVEANVAVMAASAKLPDQLDEEEE